MWCEHRELGVDVDDDDLVHRGMNAGLDDADEFVGSELRDSCCFPHTPFMRQYLFSGKVW
jgi:hypothetical protein